MAAGICLKNSFSDRDMTFVLYILFAQHDEQSVQLISNCVVD